jgi:hypothetical protein
MERSEWVGITEQMQAIWPNATIPDVTIVAWYEYLKQRPVEEVRAAVESFFEEGREFPPNAGQVLARIQRAEQPAIDYGEAWELVHWALWKFAPYEWTKFYETLPPLVAEAARRYGFETQGGYQNDDEGVVRAQFRDIYREVVDGRRHDKQYAQIRVRAAGNGGRDGEPRKLGSAIGRVIPGKAEREEPEDDR